MAMAVELPPGTRSTPAWGATVSPPRIVFEDQFLLVLVKPAGLVMHPACGHADGTFWDLLCELFAARGLPERPRLLHRLDSATSGLVCVPKTLPAHRRLERSLRLGRFSKGYLALVTGRAPATGLLTDPLGRDLADRRRVCVRPDGQPARTRFLVARRFQGYTLLLVLPETGRTHQIRVHLAHAGFPLVGDAVYGRQAPWCPRLFLHAGRLAFPHPEGGPGVRCRIPLPPELLSALACLQAPREDHP
jgi:23S rRNA pseudouridine1911/1915/1917 synthase